MLAAALLVVASCAHVGYVTPEDLRVKVLDVDVGFPKSGGLPLEFQVLVTNFSSADLVVRGLRYRLRINDKDALEGGTDAPFVVESDGQSEVVLPLNVQYEELGMSLKSMARLGRSQYRLEGEVLVKGLIGDVRVPFEKSGTIGLGGVE